MKYCPQPFEVVNIHRGNMSPCLCDGWHDPLTPRSSPMKESIIDIFNNQTFTNFRQTIVDQSFKHCRKYQCPELWNLIDIDSFEEINLRPVLPTTVHLHIDANCNLKCSSCRHSIYYSPEINKHAAAILDRLVEAYESYTGTVTIYADGTGDIFASAAYKQFLTSNKVPKSFKFCFTTNGNLITKNLDILDNLKNQIDVVVISFDAATEETYKEIRGGKFSLILDGVAELQKRNIKVCTQYVLQYKNYTEVDAYVTLCKKLNIEHIGIQKIDRWPHQTLDWWQSNQVDNNPNVDYNYLIPTLIKLQQEPNVGLCGGTQDLINQLSVIKNKST